MSQYSLLIVPVEPVVRPVLTATYTKVYEFFSVLLVFLLYHAHQAYFLLLAPMQLFLLTVADDIIDTPIYSLEGNTDCPEAPVTESNPDGEWKFYLETGYVGNGSVTICMLPQER